MDTCIYMCFLVSYNLLHLFPCLNCPDLVSGSPFNLVSVSFWRAVISLYILPDFLLPDVPGSFCTFLVPALDLAISWRSKLFFSGSEPPHWCPSSHHCPLLPCCCLLCLVTNSSWTELFWKRKGTFCLDLIIYVSSVWIGTITYLISHPPNACYIVNAQ